MNLSRRGFLLASGGALAAPGAALRPCGRLVVSMAPATTMWASSSFYSAWETQLIANLTKPNALIAKLLEP